MKSQKQIETRLNAEIAACTTDPTLNYNDYVQGYVAGLKFVLDEEAV